MTAKYGTPYFSNYVNSDLDPSAIRSMCIFPDSIIHIFYKGHHWVTTIEYMYDYLDVNEVKIFTRYGYRPIKEKQRFGYSGFLYKFITESGNFILTTPDHPHIIYTKEEVEGGSRHPRMTKVPAMNVRIGDYFSMKRDTSATAAIGRARRGKTVEEIYGEEKGVKIREQKSQWCKENGIFAGANNPAYGGLPDEWRMNISRGEQGHYVSEECRRASSERWKGENNPHNINGGRVDGRYYSVSPYEDPFADELDGLGIEYQRQVVIPGAGISDFYIPSKNLVVELETDYRFTDCSYNDTSRVFIQTLKDKYDSIIKAGYNLLIFNPTIDNGSYRSIINKMDKIVAIEMVPYNGYVYDVEVDCDDLDPNMYDIEMAHSFYANDVLTGNCCRLRLDLRELRKKTGGYFGSGESTGSIGVVTINMPRIGYLAENEDDFYKRLDHLMDLAAKSLKTKRTVVTDLLEKGLYPYTKRYLGHFNNHFSTIGLVGMNEACLNAKWLREDLTQPRAIQFTKDVLNHMLSRLSDYQEMYGDLYNLEATPAESTTYRFAKHDKEKYPDIITANENGTPYYTNSSHLPVGFTEDVFSALDIQDELQTLYTSGTVFHAFLGEKLPDWKSAMNLVRKIAENYRLPYYTMSPTYAVCKNHGYLTGEVYKCPHCGEPTEVYSRITGYYRPVQNWNDGKAQEFKDRRTYDIGRSTLTHKGPKEIKVMDENPGEECETCKIDTSEKVENTVEMESCVSCTPTLVEAPVVDGDELVEGFNLFATHTCPNCKNAKGYMDEKGVKYSVVYADDRKDLARKYKVMAAPTIVEVKDGEVARVIRGMGAIRTMVETEC